MYTKVNELAEKIGEKQMLEILAEEYKGTIWSIKNIRENI